MSHHTPNNTTHQLKRLIDSILINATMYIYNSDSCNKEHYFDCECVNYIVNFVKLELLSLFPL